MAENINDFIAGWVGGAAGVIIGSPLDVLKARMQAPATQYLSIGSELQHRKGTWQTFKSMVESEGLGSMFKGVLSPVIGLAGLNALLFLTYGSILRYFEHVSNQEPFVPTLLQIFWAGFGAGVACFFLSTPTELVKIKAQMSKVSKSTIQVANEIYATSGIKGFYQGGVVTMIRDAPSYGIYFWAYEGMKRYLQVQSKDDTAWKLLMAGGIAGAISWIVIYPIDVVKSRLQMQYHHKPNESASLLDRPYASIRDCFVRSYQTEGLSVFFRGLWPTILRGFPVNAITFYFYEVTLHLLQ